MTTTRDGTAFHIFCPLRVIVTDGFSLQRASNVEGRYAKQTVDIPDIYAETCWLKDVFPPGDLGFSNPEIRVCWWYISHHGCILCHCYESFLKHVNQTLVLLSATCRPMRYCYPLLRGFNCITRYYMNIYTYLNFSNILVTRHLNPSFWVCFVLSWSKIIN